MKKITKNGNYNNFAFSKAKDKVTVKGLKNIKTGQFITYTVEITISKPDIKKGDGICVGVPFGFTLPQISKPQNEGYTTFTHNSKAVLGIKIHPKKERFIRIVAEEDILRAKDKIKICFGDMSKGSPGTMAMLQAAKDVLIPYCRINENKPMQYLPRIKIGYQNFNCLRCHISSTFKKKDKVKLTIIAEDEYGNRSENFKGEIKFLNRNISNNLPAKISINPKDKGKKQFSFIPKDISSFRVSCKHKDNYILSNPCIKLDASLPYNLYFGEIHAHSELSHDAVGSIDELYRFAKDTAVLDFSAATDHQTGIRNLREIAEHPASLLFFDMADMPFRWKMTCDKAKEYNKPGKFVTFPGFEFAPSGLNGDRNLYFLEDYPEMIKAPDNWENYSGKDILNPYIKNRKVLVVPHHPAINWGAYIEKKGAGMNYSDVNSKYQPVIELYSKHGCSEYYGTRRPLRGQILGHFANDILEAGYKFGFIAGSDTHQGNPGSSMTYSGPFTTLQYRNGLAAVWAKDLTRKSLWEAIFARRTYATTYNKTIVLFHVNNLFMGEEGTVTGTRKIKLKVLSNTRIIKVEILKNNEVIFAYTAHLQPDFEIEYEDKKRSSRNVDFYYARIIETENDIAWSSPVWVKKK